MRWDDIDQEVARLGPSAIAKTEWTPEEDRRNREERAKSAQKKPLGERLLVPPRGTVQPAKPSQKTRNFERQRAKASAATPHQLESDLQIVVDRWPELPAPIKVAILAMIQAS